MFKFLLILLLIGFSFQKCTKEDDLKMKNCIGSLGEAMQKLSANVAGTEGRLRLPKPEVLKDVIQMCRKATECMASIECEVAKRDSGRLDKLCQVLEFTNAELSCLKKFEAALLKPDNKYPCAEENNIDVSLCNIFNGWKCAGPIVENVCGQNSFKAFDDKKEFVRTLLTC